MSTQRCPFTGAVRRVGTWRHLRLPRSIIGQRNQRQIAFSISWTHQEPRGLVGSSVISDPAVPGSNSTMVISLFLCHFFCQSMQSENSEIFQTLSHVRRWPPHMCTSEVYRNLPAGYYRVKNLPKSYNRDLHTSGQSMCSNGRLAIETAIKNLSLVGSNWRRASGPKPLVKNIKNGGFVVQWWERQFFQTICPVVSPQISSALFDN